MPSNLFKYLCFKQAIFAPQKTTMNNSTLAFPLILLLLFSAHQKGVDAQDNCYDSCNTACVNPDVRLYLRCDGKCKIRCSPDLAAAAAGNRG